MNAIHAHGINSMQQVVDLDATSVCRRTLQNRVMFTIPFNVLAKQLILSFSVIGTGNFVMSTAAKYKHVTNSEQSQMFCVFISHEKMFQITQSHESMLLIDLKDAFDSHCTRKFVPAHLEPNAIYTQAHLDVLRRHAAVSPYLHRP